MSHTTPRGSGPRLLVDLGGTNTRCALQESGEEPHIVRSVKNSGFPGLLEVLRSYIEDLPADLKPAVGALAVAAPISGDHIQMTNIGWEFSKRELRESLGMERLEVTNDFTAIAMSLPYLPQDARIKIGRGRAVKGRAIGVIGPGTGLGVSGLLPAPGGWVAISGEGGHVTLSANDEREASIISFLRQQQGHVSAERLISGSGLTTLYMTLKSLSGSATDEVKRPEQISALADKGDAMAQEALELFFSFLGSVAGNLALTLGAFGGIYVAGGIVPRVQDAFMSSDFRSRFEGKGRYTDYMKRIPTYLVTEKHPAFRGLAAMLDGHLIEPPDIASDS